MADKPTIVVIGALGDNFLRNVVDHAMSEADCSADFALCDVRSAAQLPQIIEQCGLKNISVDAIDFVKSHFVQVESGSYRRVLEAKPLLFKRNKPLAIYASIPPQNYPKVLDGIIDTFIPSHPLAVIGFEKPFGTCSKTSKELDLRLGTTYVGIPIDHYLEKWASERLKEHVRHPLYRDLFCQASRLEFVMLENSALSAGRVDAYFGALHDMGIHLASLYDGFTQATGSGCRIDISDTSAIQGFAASHLGPWLHGKPADAHLNRITYAAFRLPAKGALPEIVFEFGKCSSSGNRKLVRVRRDYESGDAAIVTYDLFEGKIVLEATEPTLEAKRPRDDRAYANILKNLAGAALSGMTPAEAQKERARAVRCMEMLEVLRTVLAGVQIEAHEQERSIEPRHAFQL